MHHFLVESRHGDGDKRTGKNLFDKKFTAVDVSEKNRCEAACIQLRQAFPQRKIEAIEHIVHANHQTGQHAGGLQRVSPDNCFNAALKGVKQDHHEDDQSRHPERHMQPIKNGILQNLYHEIEAGCGT